MNRGDIEAVGVYACDSWNGNGGHLFHLLLDLVLANSPYLLLLLKTIVGNGSIENDFSMVRSDGRGILLTIAPRDRLGCAPFSHLDTFFGEVVEKAFVAEGDWGREVTKNA